MKRVAASVGENFNHALRYLTAADSTKVSKVIIQALRDYATAAFKRHPEIAKKFPRALEQCIEC